MTETVKKAVRLEDKLRDAEKALAEAKRVLAEAEAKIAITMAEHFYLAPRAAQAAETAAGKVEDVAIRAYEAARKEATSRLGLTPAAAKRAVMTWAGLQPDEEGEAMVRGEPGKLDNAVRNIVNGIVGKDPAVIAADKARNLLMKERMRWYETRTALERTTRQERGAVHRCNDAVHDLIDKIAARDYAQTKRVTKAVPKEDQVRFIEARRRLIAAANAGSLWDTGAKIDKLDPPFVWPPKEKR
jgi:hypothetical protein